MGRGSEKAYDHRPEKIYLGGCLMMSDSPSGLKIPEGGPRLALGASRGPACSWCPRHAYSEREWKHLPTHLQPHTWAWRIACSRAVLVTHVPE